MKSMLRLLWGGIALFVAAAMMPAPAAEPFRAAQAGSKLNHANFFPIGVWLQNPQNAPRFKAAGINLYVGLWRGPTADQIKTLEKHGMPVICAQNEFGLKQKDNPIILAWMHGDEPDNAQPLGDKKGYGPPIAPEKIQQDYRRIKEADPDRPVFLNLGQGVAWDDWIGRGVRRNHPEDYLEYVKGADIVSFDIYPVVHRDPAVAGKLEVVARGVERLKKWGKGRPVWNVIECTHIGNPDAKASPDQIRAQVWMSIIHGSQGIIYFVHQFEPEFREAALLEDPENLAAVTRINGEIQGLARVLKSPTMEGKVTVQSSNPEVPVAMMVKEFDGDTYIFTVAMRDDPTDATFQGRGLPASGELKVLGENRQIPVREGRFTDRFSGYGVHLYRITN